ncbi:TRAP transporter substrate-binding protein [Variovorax sp. PCZ-1]|uniref:TRAP transporter substrate-binding protein n=1 Tax=Variovorax sp. PCZ-1 TaxID=2835533 RepID=UPI001BCB3ECB|nr:TRAP transporter substrate-binding protein [Variovorax sp. PCZ-1]MBS7807212.1 TRAP transporter substrate-binding protein [Variovorax sp. PCZ-1]
MKLFAMAALLAAGASFAQNSASTTWKLATGYRAESFHGKNLSQFADEVKAATQGQLSIELHPNNALIKLTEIRASVEAGKVQAGESIMSGLTKDIPTSGADSVPFVVSTYADAQRLWKSQRPLTEKAFAQRGLKVLYAVPWPPQGLHSKKPILSMQDFKGTTMRTYNPTTLRIAELLGAKGQDVPMVEVGKALKEGRIDSMITSAVTGAENKVWGDIKHYYEINAWFPKNIVYVNAKAFTALSAPAQKAVMDAAAQAEQRGWQMSQKAAADSTEELRANGVKIERIPREIDVALKRLGEKFSREWVTSVGQDATAIFTPYYFDGISGAQTAQSPSK